MKLRIVLIIIVLAISVTVVVMHHAYKDLQRTFGNELITYAGEFHEL